MIEPAYAAFCNAPYSSLAWICSLLMSLMDFASPRSLSKVMPYQFTSISYHLTPCLAAAGNAWWLLCHPSPNVNKATNQLLVESSDVLNRRLPHKCVAEFTSHVACRPKMTRKNTPHISAVQPPTARSARPQRIKGTKYSRFSHI